MRGGDALSNGMHPLTPENHSAPIRRVKFAFSLLALAALTFTACNTNATRRDMYAPAQANGPYSQALDNGTWWRGVKARKPKATPAPTAGKPEAVVPEVAPAL